jgi:hypothetical protein
MLGYAFSTFAFRSVVLCYVYGNHSNSYRQLQSPTAVTLRGIEQVVVVVFFLFFRRSQQCTLGNGYTGGSLGNKCDFVVCAIHLFEFCFSAETKHQNIVERCHHWRW